MVGENGGGAFLVLYVVFAILIGVPLLSTELTLGRTAQKSPIAGMEALTGSRRSPWNLIGWLGVGTMGLIAAYYVMLMSWILAYAGLLATGRSLGADPTETAAVFAEFTASPVPQLLISALLSVGLVLLVGRGLQAGLERLAKVAMPLLVVMLLGLAVWSISLPGAGAGLAWYLTPPIRGGERFRRHGGPRPGLLFHRHWYGGGLRLR